jgi:hypothetical protein
MLGAGLDWKGHQVDFAAHHCGVHLPAENFQMLQAQLVTVVYGWHLARTAAIMALL